MAGPYYTNTKVDNVDFIEAADLEAIETGFSNVDSDKSNKAIPATAHNVATLDSTGDLEDGGVIVINSTDTVASNGNDTSIPTTLAIKSYVDSQVGANNELSEILGNGNTSGATDIVITAGQKITVDTIDETTAAAGVTADGVLLKDSQVSTDQINELTAAAGVTVDGVLLKDSQVTTDTINEKTAAAGVTIDGVVLKDGGATVTADVNFGDNDKAIFGAGSDLQIYHDGADSYIKDAGTGNLVLESNSAGIWLQKTGGEFLAKFNLDAQCELYYDNSKKLETTSTGINVTGLTETDTLQIGSAFSLPTGHTFAMNGLLAQTSSPTNVRNTFNAISLGNECSWLVGNAKWVANFSSGYATTTGNTQYITNDNSYGNAAGLLKFHGNGGQWQFYSVDTPSGTAADTDIDWSSAQILSMGQAGADFNSGQTTGMDFRVRSANQSHMLYVDAGTDRVGIGRSSVPNYTLDVAGVISSEVGSGDARIRWKTGTKGGWIGTPSWNSDAMYLYSPTTTSSEQHVMSYNGGTADGFVFLTGATPAEALRIEDSGNVVLSNATPTLQVGSSAVSTGSAKIELGQGRTNSGYAYIDLVGDTTYSDYGLRIIRGNGGANTGSSILHKGTGDLLIGAESGSQRITLNTTDIVINELGADCNFRIESDTRTHALYVDGENGYVGIWNSTPESALDVSGDVRANSYRAQYRFDVTTDIYWFKIFETSYDAATSYASNGHRIYFNGNGQTGGVMQTGELEINWKQQGTSDYFQIRPVQLSNMSIAYKWNATGGNEGSGLLEVWAKPDFQYCTVFMEVHSAHGLINIANGNVESFPIANTYSASTPSGATVVEATLENKGTWWNQNGPQVTAVRYNNDIHIYDDNSWASLAVRGGGGSDTYGLFQNYGNTGSGSYLQNIGAGPLRFGANAVETHRVFDNAFIVNENSADIDFRVESDATTHALKVDGGTSQISIYGDLWATNPTSTTLQVSGNIVQSNDPTYARNTFTAMSWGGHCSWLAGNAYRATNAKTGGQPLTVTGQCKFLDDLNQYGNSAGILAFNANGAIWDFKYAGISTGQGTGQDDDINWTGGTLLTMGPNVSTFNGEGQNRDFCVESDSNASMLYVDASTDSVCIGKSTNATSTNGTAMSGSGMTISSTAGNTYHTYNNASSTYSFYVSYNGTVYYTGLSALSDQREKTNIVDLPVGLDAVKQLRPRQFDWINEDQDNGVYGFIAQEVEEVLPSLVSDYMKDEDVTRKSLKHVELIAVLTKAIQEQQTTIESLTARIAALETAS